MFLKTGFAAGAAVAIAGASRLILGEPKKHTQVQTPDKKPPQEPPTATPKPIIPPNQPVKTDNIEEA